MDSKNFIMMTVTLILGIILVAGVLTPVIADSINSGTGSGGTETDITGYDRYAKVTNSTNVTIYPCYDNETEMFCYSYTDPDEDPNAEIHTLYGGATIVGDGWIANMFAGGSPGNMGASWTIEVGDDLYDVNVIHVSNGVTTIQGYVWGTSTEVTVEIPSMIYYPSPDGQYVDPTRYADADADAEYLPYYGNGNTELVCRMTLYDQAHYDTWNWEVISIGTANNNSVFAMMHNSTVVNEYSDSMSFGIEDGVIKTASITADDVLYTASLPSYSQDSDDHVGGEILIISASVYTGGSSEGTSVSPTLASLLTVIPILVLAGLVIMVIMMFKKS